jgi:hypothetical protein
LGAASAAEPPAMHRSKSVPGEIDRIARNHGNDDATRLPGIRAQYEKSPQPKKLIVLEGSALAQFLLKTDQTIASCARPCDFSRCHDRFTLGKSSWDLSRADRRRGVH